MSDKLNFRKVKKIVFPLMDELRNSSRTFKDIFNLEYKEGEKTYLRYRDKGEMKSLSYKATQGLIYSKAHEISETLKDINKGEFVVLKLDNCPEWIISFWAILIAGYKPFLMNTRLHDEYNLKIISHLSSKAIISDKPFGDLIYINAFSNPNFNDKELDNEWEDEIALATTGTSGEPKLCFYKGANMSAQLLQAEDIVRNNKDIQSIYHGKHQQLAFLPFYHIFGLNAVLMWFSFFHQILVFPTSLDSNGIKDTIASFEVTSFSAIPLVFNLTYKAIIKEAEKNNQTEKLYKGLKLSYSLQKMFPRLGQKIARNLIFKKTREKIFGPSLTFLISGGGYIDKEVMYLFNGLGYRLVDGYGMSEVGITSVEQSKYINKICECSVGKPLEGILYKLDDQNRLWIKGPSLAYKVLLNNEEIKKDDEGYYPSNDIASIDKEGRLFIISRSDDVIVLDNGELVSPDQIENYFDIPNIENKSCLYIDKTINLFVHFNSNINQFVKYETIQKLFKINAEIPSFYKFSKVYEAKNPLPVVMKGNVSRNLLLKDFKENKDSFILLNNQDYSKKVEVVKNEYMDSALEVIKKAFAQVLDVDVSTINDNSHFIYDLNGDSIIYFNLLAVLNEELSLSVDPGNVEDMPATPLEFLNLLMKEDK